MPSTTRYRRGDIVLVPFPFTDLSSTKKRPALVVSPDKFNEHAQDVVLVAITSQPSDSHVVSLDEHDYVDGKLPRTSFVKVSTLLLETPSDDPGKSVVFPVYIRFRQEGRNGQPIQHCWIGCGWFRWCPTPYQKVVENRILIIVLSGNRTND